MMIIHDAIDAEAKRQVYWHAMREVCASLRQAKRDGFSWPEWWEGRWRTLEYFHRIWRAARDWQRNEARND